jgi:hypothetical protein
LTRRRRRPSNLPEVGGSSTDTGEREWERAQRPAREHRAELDAAAAAVDDARARDPLETQVLLADALNELVGTISERLHGAEGAWMYQDIAPIGTSYSKFAGSYDVGGELHAILRSSTTVDVQTGRGADVLRRFGVLAAEQAPWEATAFEVVLHFFTDPDDHAGDSQRVLTNALRLEEVFDVRADAPNVIAEGFGDLLRFVRRRLDAFYGRSYSLVTSDERSPFYLVVRQGSVSENFYLPVSWMPLALDDIALRATESSLRSRISRLYDYGNGSRQLTDEELAALFGG